jgi:predicted transcriptional regulator
MTAPVTIDFDEETLIALGGFAASMGLSRSELIKLALKEWLTAQTWNIAEIEAGLAEADRCMSAAHEEIAAVFSKHGVKYGPEP